MATVKNSARRFGDRREGRKIRSIGVFHKFAPFIMKTRSEAGNYINDSVEISETEKWIRRKRAEGYNEMDMLHVFVAAYVRTTAMIPALNRFVSGQRIFARDSVDIVLTVKRAGAADAAETAVKVTFDTEDTVFDVYRKLNNAVDEIKAGDEETYTEKIAGALCSLPALFLKFTIWALNILDYLDLLPIRLIEASPFHGSMIITDTGELGFPPVYRHLYNFGNIPVALAFGPKRKAVELSDELRAETRKYIDFTAVADGRTGNGFCCAEARKCIKRFIGNPADLENTPEKVENDVF